MKTICEDLGFSSLGYQSLEGLLEAIGIDKEAVQKFNGLPQLGTPDNGIIHEQQFFPLDQLGYGNLLHLSLGYQSLEGLLEAIGIDKEKVCTYCWTGKE